MVRKPPTISIKHNLATALAYLTERDLDSALIVDEQGCACGLVSTEVLIKLWRAWWTNCNEDLEGDLTLDEMRELYSRGAFPHFDGYPRGFNVFSVLANPLDNCQLVGVHVERFRDYMESEVSAMMTNKKVNMAVLRRIAIHNMLKYHSSDSDSSDEEDDIATVTDQMDGSDTSQGHDKLANESRAHDNHNKEKGRKRKAKKVNSGKKASGKAPKVPQSVKPSKAGMRDNSRYSSLRSKDNSVNMLNVEEQEALREKQGKEKKKKEQYEIELKEFEDFAKNKALTAWLEAHNAVKRTDNLQAVLRIMHKNKTTKVFVLDERDGTPLGAVNVIDLCRKLLATEAAEKIAGFAAFRQKRHQDLVVRQVKE